MDFAEIAALGREPTPADLEPFLTAYLERHGPTKRVDLARAVETAWVTASGRSLETNAVSKLKNALEHMQARGTVAPSGTFGVWLLVDEDASPQPEVWSDESDEAAIDEPGTEVAGDDRRGGVQVELELGAGEQLVYCFYLPTFRAQAENDGLDRWPIKIGSTTGPLAARLASFATALPERPRVAVLIRTHDGALLEKALQNVLSYRGQWLSEAGGSEWYTTNPAEIVRLYELVSLDESPEPRSA